MLSRINERSADCVYLHSMQFSSVVFKDLWLEDKDKAQGLEVRGQEQGQRLVNWSSTRGSSRTRTFLEDYNTAVSSSHVSVMQRHQLFIVTHSNSEFGSKAILLFGRKSLLSKYCVTIFRAFCN